MVASRVRERTKGATSVTASVEPDLEDQARQVQVRVLVQVDQKGEKKSFLP